jgi:[ribosomal protein S5]-alanine N-acetyltransferase
MIFETERLVLRPWREEDAKNLYEIAKDPLVGPAAGWQVHTSIDNSRQIIRDILSPEGNYAITLKEEDRVIGCISLRIGKKSNLSASDQEAEIGYWMGVSYWGKGYIPEAVKELIKYSFEKLNLEILWCGYFEGNEKSKRVQEKCGFLYHHTEKDKYWEMLKEVRTEHVNQITREQWKFSH